MNLFDLVLELTPPLLRNFFYKMLLKKMGFNVFIDNKVYFRYHSRISIGNNVTIGRGCALFASHYFKDVEIIVGNNVRLGPNTTFFSAGHDYRYRNLPDTAGSIIVKDHVWIGGNATILQGVTIGEGTIVAAGSVISSSLESYKIYGGIPAKEMKPRILLTND